MGLTKKRNSRRVTAAIMAATIAMSTIYPLPATIAYANIVTDNEKAAIETRCKALQERLLESSPGQYGLLKKLNYLVEYSMYTKFICDNKLGFSKNEIQIYVHNLNIYIENFNKNYGTKKKNVRALKLKNSKDEKPYTAITENLIKKIPDYLEKVLAEIQKKMDAKNTDAEKESIMAEYESVISMCYMIFQTYDETATELTNQSSVSSTGADKTTFSIDSKDTNETIENRLAELQEKYKQILAYGEQIQKSKTTAGTVTSIDTSKTAIENFSNGYYDDSGKLVFSADPELSSAYLALLSCSAIYRPFESYVGSEDFLAAASYLCENDTEAAKLCEIYNETKNFRKPLYRRELNDNGEPSGVAKIITLQDLIDSVEKGDSFALVTIDGEFKLDQKTQTWVYTTKKEDTKQSKDASDSLDGNAGETESETESETSSDSAKVIYSVSEFPALATNGQNNAAKEIEDSVKAAAQSKTDVWDTLVRYAKQAGGQEEDLYGTQKSYTGAVKAALSRAIRSKDSWAKNIQSCDWNLYVQSRKLGTSKSDVQNAISEFISIEDKIAESDMKSDATDKDTVWSMVVNAGKSNKFSQDQLYGSDTNCLNNVGKSIESAVSTNSDWKTKKVNRTIWIQYWNSHKTGTDLVATKEVVYAFYCHYYKAEHAGLFDSNVSKTTDSEKETSGGGTASTDNSDTAYKNADVESVIDAYEEITDISKMSEPIFVVGSSKSRAVDNMTTSILTNILKNVSNLESISNKNTNFVYMNPYGDIVMDDNLLILPGIVNPIMWSSSAGYVPYTAAIMNSYPTVLYKNSKFKLYHKKDIGKYLFFGTSATAQSVLDEKTISYTSYSIFQAQSLDSFGKKELASLKLDLDFDLQDGSGGSVNLLKSKSFLYNSSTDFSSTTTSPFVRVTENTVNDKLIFPYSETDDDGFSIAKLIAGNMYNKLMKDSKSQQVKNNKLLNDNYVLQNVLIQNLNGTSNPEAYQKNALLQYENFVDNTPERIKKNLTSFANELIGSVSKTDGVIGVHNTYNLKIIGDFFNAVRSHFQLVIVVIAIVVIFCFMKNYSGLARSLIIGALSMGITYVFIMVVPVYMPYVINSVTNNLTRSLAFEMVGVQIEQESATATVMNTLDADGNIELSASSMSLYRFPFYKMGEVVEDLALTDTSEITGGNTYVINQDAGTYAEDDTIKISLASLMNTLKITGSYDSNTEGKIYQFKSYKTASNNVDYYTPYYQVVDSFIEKINKLIKIYDIPRSTSTYAKGKQKDKFAVECYLTSAPFLTPGKYGSMIDYEFEKEAGLSDDEINAYVENDEQIGEMLTDAYGQNDDWLGIATVIEAPTLAENQAIRGTLWASKLQQNGYYNSAWEMDEAKCSKLVKYVNFVTKKFIYDVEDMTAELSDDTMIKLISLYAMLALNQHSSVFPDYTYPMFINYDDMGLSNITTAIFTDDFQSFLAMNMDVGSYIADKYSIVGLLLLLLALVEITIFSTILGILFPLLYVVFGILVLTKMYSYKNVHPLVKGYLKFTIALFLEFNFLCFTFIVVRKLRGNFISILILFLVSTVLLWLMGRLILSWFEDKADMGNSAFNVNVLPSFGLLRNRNVNRMNVDSAIIGTRNDNLSEDEYFSDNFSAFSSDAGVDSMYEQEDDSYVNFSGQDNSDLLNFNNHTRED